MDTKLKVKVLFVATLLLFSIFYVRATEITQNDSTSIELSFEDKTLIDMFMSNIRQGEFEWAIEIYNQIEYREFPDLQFAYLRALERTGRNEGIYEKYQELSKKFPDFEPAYEIALFYEVRQEFDAIEKKYQYEMAKYRKNENATTYALLRRELRYLSDDYRKVKDKVLELREINPSDKRYIILLRNIYIRLNDNAEVQKLNLLLEE